MLSVDPRALRQGPRPHDGPRDRLGLDLALSFLFGGSTSFTPQGLKLPHGSFRAAPTGKAASPTARFDHVQPTATGTPWKQTDQARESRP